MASDPTQPARSAAPALGAARAVEGVRVASSSALDGATAVAEIIATIGAARDIGFVLAFASSHYDPVAITGALARHFPGVPHAGCSTAGEIAPIGVTESSLVAIAFPRGDFEIVCAPLLGLSDFGIEAGAKLVAGLRRRLPPRAEGANDVFALTLLDGLCRREEQILSALQRALDDIPLIGGSAGDDLAFRNTFAFCDGEVLHDAGLLLLVRSARPFRVFKTDHFEPTATKLVVTGCDPDERLVTEIDAEPAWEAFAHAAGLDPREPDGLGFAAHPLLVRVGGEYYCRSIQKRNDDGSLSFYCAIDTGVVLTLARTRDMVTSLEEAFGSLDRDLGGIDFVLGFDCVHRRLEAESRQILHRISDVFRRFRVIGFNTYGEQYDAMHLNHTFTGIAFGQGRRPE
ncbi:MAG: FIST N-terminal domain-containing protein [Siculibacillus sp.]